MPLLPYQSKLGLAPAPGELPVLFEKAIYGWLFLKKGVDVMQRFTVDMEFDDEDVDNLMLVGDGSAALGLRRLIGILITLDFREDQVWLRSVCPSTLETRFVLKTAAGSDLA